MIVAPSPSKRRRGVAMIAALVIAAGVAGFLVALAVTGGSSTPSGAGPPATQVRAVPRFRAVELAGSAVVTVAAGGKQSVVVHAGRNLLRRVTTRVQRGVLIIDTTGSFKRGQDVRVDVRVPALDTLTLSGSGIVVVHDVDGPRMTVALPGSGVVRASGAVTGLDVTLAGSGDAQLEQLVAQDVHALVSGSGRIVVQARGSLDASVTGSGAIMYSGNPARVTKNVSGSGAIVGG